MGQILFDGLVEKRNTQTKSERFENYSFSQVMTKTLKLQIEALKLKRPFTMYKANENGKYVGRGKSDCFESRGVTNAVMPYLRALHFTYITFVEPLAEAPTDLVSGKMKNSSTHFTKHTLSEYISFKFFRLIFLNTFSYSFSIFCIFFSFISKILFTIFHINFEVILAFFDL